MAAGALVIAIASSAPGGREIPSGDTGAQRPDTARPGADNSGAAGDGTGVAQAGRAPARDSWRSGVQIPSAGPFSIPGAAPGYTVTATPWLGALRLASRYRAVPGSTSLSLAAVSSGEADYKGGDARVESGTKANDLQALALGVDFQFDRSVLGTQLDEARSGARNAHGARADVRGTLTRRACAARRGLAYNCAAVSERETSQADANAAWGHARGSTLSERVSFAAQLNAPISRSETCRAARKALTRYVSRVNYWRAKRGAASREQRSYGRTTASRCPTPYLVGVWRAKAHAARLRYERWHRYHYAWREWLPDKWQRIGACETGYGKRPGNWHWDSGRYVSAFGIYRPAYADDAHHAGLLSWDETLRKLHRYPTPREQYRTALSHYRLHGGFSGWGCRGA